MMLVDMSWEVVGKLLITGFLVFLGGSPIVACWWIARHYLRPRTQKG